MIVHASWHCLPGRMAVGEGRGMVVCCRYFYFLTAFVRGVLVVVGVRGKVVVKDVDSIAKRIDNGKTGPVHSPAPPLLLLVRKSRVVSQFKLSHRRERSSLAKCERVQKRSADGGRGAPPVVSSASVSFDSHWN